MGRVIYDSGIPERIRIPEQIPDQIRIPEQIPDRIRKSGMIPDLAGSQILSWYKIGTFFLHIPHETSKLAWYMEYTVIS